MAKPKPLKLAPDKSNRPVRGTERGDNYEGDCEAEGCGEPIHRGDLFVAYLGDRLMCIRCHMAEVPLRKEINAQISPRDVR